MALDYTLYQSKKVIKPRPTMPEPPNKLDVDPNHWKDYLLELDAYKTAYLDHLKSIRDYAVDQAALLDQFKIDALNAYDLDGNPKVDALYTLSLQLAAMYNVKVTLQAIEVAVSRLAPLVL